MGSGNKINNVLRHKRIIILGLIVIGLIVMIFLVYVLTYANNKPKAFTSDSNVKITNKCDYFDFNIKTDSIKWKKDTTTGEIVCRGEISNIKQTISGVTLTLEIHNNWTSKGDYTSSSEYNFNSGNTLSKDHAEAYYSDKATLKLNVEYPIKVIPLVKVKKPTIYAKVTYTRKKPDSIKGEGGSITETVYYRFSFNEYVDDSTSIS